eukprot:5702930-Amphidinium_carterae.1
MCIRDRHINSHIGKPSGVLMSSLGAFAHLAVFLFVTESSKKPVNVSRSGNVIASIGLARHQSSQGLPSNQQRNMLNSTHEIQ